MTDFIKKRLIIFDLDGTLAQSKSSIDSEMQCLIEELLKTRKVLVISGGKWRQFKVQLLDKLNLSPEQLVNLFIATGGGSSMYRFEEGEVREMYSNVFDHEEREKVLEAFKYAMDAAYEKPEKTYGDIIEDRGSQITFSGLGQEAPLEEKNKWDPDRKKRQAIVYKLMEKIPDFEIHMGGATSIDITQKGKDKAFGIRNASDRLGIPLENILYVGDALYPGGNDEPALETGVDCQAVKDIENTKRLIKEIISQ
ncbi:HAD-IIB family hydrolase [Candidatus Parcubacteria bacterium]|nr:HAD-IIB family hydrolase [Candidatus Parcubacteria bacterium]